MAARAARRSDPPDKRGEQSKRRRVEQAPEVERHQKTRRSDVSARRERNAATDVSVVKCSLKSFCNPGAETLPWTSVLLDTNKAVAEAYALANLHVLRLCQAREAIPALDQSFFYQCLSAVSVGARARKEILDDRLRLSVGMYKASRGDNVPFASSAHISSGWFQASSQEMAKNARTHILNSFNMRLRRLARLRFRLKGSPLYRVLRDAVGLSYDGVDDQVLQLRQMILQDGDGDFAQALQEPHLLLPVTFRILQAVEEINVGRLQDTSYRQQRAFSLLPFKRGFLCSHVKMNSHGLYGLLKRARTTGLPPLTEWLAVADTWWRRLFKISKFETATSKFAGEVVTDGKAVSVVLRKPKALLRPSGGASAAEFDEVWGVDPGMRDMIVASSNRGRTISCSTAEFYEEAKYTSTTRTVRRWIAHDRPFQDACWALPTRRTSSVDQLVHYIAYLTPRLDELLGFCALKPFRKLRFKRFIYERKKLRVLCLALTASAGERTLVGFGDWSATNHDGVIKRCATGPVKQLERELKRCCTVIPVDEYRTSKLHADCHRKLVYQWAKRGCKDGVVRRSKVYSVLHCPHNGCFGTTVNRDKNASKNILSLTLPCWLGQPRDPDFCRTGMQPGEQFPGCRLVLSELQGGS